jgi:hypothetical protein
MLAIAQSLDCEDMLKSLALGRHPQWLSCMLVNMYTGLIGCSVLSLQGTNVSGCWVQDFGDCRVVWCCDMVLWCMSTVVRVCTRLHM